MVVQIAVTEVSGAIQSPDLAPTVKQLQHQEFNSSTTSRFLSVIALQRFTVPPRRILASHIPERDANEVINLFVSAIGPWTHTTEVTLRFRRAAKV